MVCPFSKNKRGRIFGCLMFLANLSFLAFDLWRKVKFSKILAFLAKTSVKILGENRTRTVVMRASTYVPVSLHMLVHMLKHMSEHAHVSIRVKASEVLRTENSEWRLMMLLPPPLLFWLHLVVVCVHIHVLRH